MSAKTMRVIPYVEDHRNCLLFKPSEDLMENQMASLQAALKQAIQAYYQLEDDELAAEPLPNTNNRRLILFYEAAEGGAGVLRQLISDREAFPAVARKALEICHFDPDTGEDLLRATGASEDCEAACYDCLMSYGNQRDHRLLDRKSIRELLLSYYKSTTSSSPGPDPRAEHLRRLLNQAGSELEKRWLQFIDERNLNLPDKAQHLFEPCKTRPDFLYEEHYVFVYIDGPVHTYPDRKQRDREQTECLEDMGYTVIRFGDLDEWEGIVSKFPHVFGITK
ncbi:MAG: DUF1998 domain-containing protein [Deltaproteobacteria bacterium]|nr:DUF1998 domain-containing protein [Deltaproteobacteria bacterium]